MDDLKPCPFCGGKAEMLYTGKYECFIHCRRGCVEQTRLYKAKSSAVKAWNRRASIDSERKKGQWIDVDPHGDSGLAFRCSECAEINLRESRFCPSCGAKMV